jgi:hypothetical protein
MQWYRATGSCADDQWNDLMGVVKVQAPALDAAYLRARRASCTCCDSLHSCLSVPALKGMLMAQPMSPQDALQLVLPIIAGNTMLYLIYLL